MRWSYWDVLNLPVDVYAELIEWLEERAAADTHV